MLMLVPKLTLHVAGIMKWWHFPPHKPSWATVLSHRVCCLLLKLLSC